MGGRTLFVLGGGGALGAFQAGAVRALTSAGVLPDGLYGTSVGALNAAFLGSGPSVARADELVQWWTGPAGVAVLAPSLRTRMSTLPAVVRSGARGLLDPRPLRALIDTHVRAHDVSELAVPMSVTTTCLDCAAARHHDHGPVNDLLVASCALPGLFPPVRLSDGHLHVDGGIVCGVPLVAALADAGPDDRIIVLDCGLDPVTGRPDRCAASPDSQLTCGLGPVSRQEAYQPPADRSRGALDVVLRAFTVARSVANRAAVSVALDDPHVYVAPHVADAWAVGLLAELPRGTRDVRVAHQLAVAGQAATEQWLNRLDAGEFVSATRG